MPKFSDKALIVNTVAYGEQDGVVSFFTKEHGLTKAFVRRAFSKKTAAVVQTGNFVNISYAARLEEQLGTAVCDLEKSVAGKTLNAPDALSVLSCICAVLTLLPENVSEPELFEDVENQFQLAHTDGIFERYARFELRLLSVLGFGLDLSCCALTGTTENLSYVSPKSGRAVSFEAGAPWREKLLELPCFLLNSQEGIETGEIKKALILTGFFLENYACKHINCPFPPARRRLFERVSAK